MPSSTGSSGSPTGSNLTKCVFKKICSWEDANVSAAVLTAGNLFVLFLLNENPIAWIQFCLIFGLLPLGLAARVFGFDSQIRERVSGISGSMFVSHGTRNKITASEVIRMSVGMICAARMISVFGFPLTLGIVGNLVMLVPLVWSYVDTEQITATSETVKKSAQESTKMLVDILHGVHEMLMPVIAGLLTFITIVGIGKVSDSIFVALLSLVGYTFLLGIAIAPETVTSGRIVSLIGSSPMTKVYEPTLRKVGYMVTSLVFWESFTHSVAAFLGLYAVYVISAFTGLAFVVALVGGLTVTFAASPSVVREKFEAELVAIVTGIEAKISSFMSKKNEKEAEEVKPTISSESDENVVIVNAQEKL